MRIRCPSCKKAFSLPDSMRTGKGKCPHCGQRLDIGRMPRKGELQPGETLGGCRIEGLLGRGGMAVVYKAVQLSLERNVALKVLPERLARDKQFVRRFNREASALARLSHPNIVAILDKGVDRDTYYFVMEYVEGRSLQSRLQREKKLSPQETHEIMQGVCAALEYAHEHKVVHRDLKPGNILLDVNGTPKLADFGIARIIEAGTATDQRQLTMAHTVMGSADYMAPEQRTDAAKADHRADIYALGVMLYQMLTGELPVGTFKPASRLVPGLSPAVDRAIRTALAHEPDDRFSSVTRLRAALNAAFTEGVSRSPRRSAPAPKKHAKAVGILATVGIMAGLAVLLAVMLSQRGKVPDPPPEGPPKKPPKKVVEPPTKAGAKKTPTPKKEDPKDDGREPAHVRKALARFRAFVDAYPRKFQEQIERLKDLAIRQNDPEVIKAIQAERNGVLRRLEEATDAELAAMAARAKDLADQRKFSAAFKVYAKFPSELSTQDSKLKIGKAVLALKQRASDTLDRDIQQAAELVKEGKGLEAEALLRDTDYGAPDIKERAAAELGKLRTLLAQDEARRDAEAKKAIAALTDTLKARWAGRDYAEALAAVRDAQASAQDGAALAPHLAAATLLDAFWKAVLEGVELHKGRKVNIRDTTYTLEGMVDGKLELTKPVGKITPSLKSLDVADLLFFAGSRVDRKKPAGQLTVALLYTYDKTPDAARADRAFAQASELGADKALIAAFRDLGRAATPEPETPVVAQEAPKGFALDFNGASDYVEVPDKRSRPCPLHLKTFTVEAWVWRRPGGDEVQHIVTKNAGWTNSFSFALYTDEGKWAYATGDGMSISKRVTRTVAPFGAWVHVALVVSEGSSVLFVDGESVDRSAAPKFLGYDDQPLTIGACKVDGNMAGFWSGAIDEVRVSLGPRYQKSFTPERVCRPDARTQLLLRFEEGKGTAPRDLSRYRHRAEIHGAKFLDLAALAPPTNVVAHWSFDNDKLDGSIVLNDAGSAYAAQIVGTVQFGQGVNGQSVVFDGTSYLLVNQGKTLALRQFTLAAWIKPTGVTARTGILAKRLTAAAAPFSLLLGGGRVIFEVDTRKGTKIACTSTVAVQPGVWQHVAVSVGDTIALYVNGAPAGKARLRGAPMPNAEPLIIGRDATGTRARPVAQPGGYVGALDDLRIWARPLSAAEIAKLAKR